MANTAIKKFVLQIIERNDANPLQAGPIHSIEGDDLIELLSKLPLLIIEMQEKKVKEQIKEWMARHDDIPF